MPGIGAFISPGKSLERALGRVKLADRLGFDAAYTTHIAGRDGLTTLMAYAAVSERIRLGTGVVPIFSRPAATMAQTAATIDEYSGGRMVLGLGVSHRITVENWLGQRIDKPVTQMREYAQVVRAILLGEAPPASEYFPTQFRFMGYSARADLPIYVAALSSNMLRLAGEVADGVMLWLCSPSYIRDTVIPSVREGLEAAGRSPQDFDVVAAVPIALADDPEAARATFRQDLIPYASLPFYRAMLEASGFDDELAAFDAGMADGDVERAKAGLSDRMLDELAGIGTKEDVQAAVRRYQEAGVVSPCVGGIPRTDYDAGLEAVAELF
ncbi:MAG TPA: LLM class flavin-dependent oxidoreductase [Solirubrobacterales bacterium]|nr:LLM class flavin-dependent oxidoreductase [Solirubrobacterales bacterium]